MNPVRELLERESFFDAAVLRHGYTDYMRDYEIVVSGRRGAPHTDVHRYQFGGCVEAHCVTRVRPEVFATSLPDEFVLAGPDYPDKPDPDGFVWGVRYSVAYPGLIYVPGGEAAKHWSEALGMPMHEITLETEAFLLRLVFAEARYELLGHEPVVQFTKQYPINKAAAGAA
jgi:hypothetical protein